MPNAHAFERGYTKRELEEHDELINSHAKELKGIHERIDKLQLTIVGFAILTIALNPSVASFMITVIKAVL